MGTTMTIPSDVVVQGSLSATSMNLAAGSVTDSKVSAGAGIQASKLQQAVRKIYATGSGVNAAAATQFMHLVLGATCTVMAVSAGAIVAAIGGATATVDIKKNGTSILASAISLSSAQSARQAVAGTITTAGGVVGDVYEVVVTATSGGGTLAQGIFVELKIYEDPS